MYEGAVSAGGNAYYFKNLDAFFEKGIRLLEKPDTTILIKASHSMCFEKIAEKITEGEENK